QNHDSERMAFSQSEQGYLSKDSRFHWVGIVLLELEGALWRREWAQTELANMLLGGLAKEKGTREIPLSLINSAVYQCQTSTACPVPFTWKKRDARIEASVPSQSLQKQFIPKDSINIACTATFAITVCTNSMELANTSAIVYSNIIAIF
ncbi:hypothetical protein EI555_007732, partial [Monodon monoceros]